MGKIASSALAAGGKVHGIIPAAVSRPGTNSRTRVGLPGQRPPAASRRADGVCPLCQFLSAEAPNRSTNTKPNEVETVVGSMHERKKLSESSCGLSEDSLSDRALTLCRRGSLAVADLSDAFIGLPGGYGTLEVGHSPAVTRIWRLICVVLTARPTGPTQEVAEMTTWSQIGVHLKPVILLNVNNFYSSLRAFIHKSVSFMLLPDVRDPSGTRRNVPAGQRE